MKKHITYSLMTLITTLLIMINTSCFRFHRISDSKHPVYSARYLSSSPATAPAVESDALYHIASPTESRSDRNGYFKGIRAGTLTAGELNDFGKWELWQDIATNELKEYQTDWDLYPLARYSVQVVNNTNNPVINCAIELLNENNKTIWMAKTDNTGKAELWDRPFVEKDSMQQIRKIRITYGDIQKVLTDVKPAPEMINIIKLKTECNIPLKADALFVVDATGSMADEIKYLQMELMDILKRIDSTFFNLDLNTGSIFYRDHGDQYVTRVSELSSDHTTTLNFIEKQNANGGGDFPEAVDEALKAAFEKISWTDDARARLLFLILDAPPHSEQVNKDRIKKYTQMASAQGVKIIPVTASGIDKSTEYLMRSLALATNGTYVFLTDHSGVGNPHIQPTTDAYNVELLNDLIYRLFLQNLTVSPCHETDSNISTFDTVFVSNIIERVILDSQYVANQNAHIADSVIFDETIDISEPDSDIIVDSSLTHIETDSNNLTDIVEEIEPKSIKIYPNPTSGYLTIETSGNIEELYLADMSGKLLEKYLIRDTDMISINISQFPNGIYLIQFIDEDRWHSGKVILRH